MRAGEKPLSIVTTMKEPETGKPTYYFWCSCGLSKKQPLCDGAHKGTGFRPVRVVADKDETVWLCTCKATASSVGRCDGSHLKGKKPVA